MIFFSVCCFGQRSLSLYNTYFFNSISKEKEYIYISKPLYIEKQTNNGRPKQTNKPTNIFLLQQQKKSKILGCLQPSLISLFYFLFSSNQIALFFLENRIHLGTHSKNPIADVGCDTLTFVRQSYLSSDIRITYAGVHVEVRTPTNTTHEKTTHCHNEHTIPEQ